MLDAPAWRCRISLSLSLSSASGLVERFPRRALRRLRSFFPVGVGLRAVPIGAIASIRVLASLGVVESMRVLASLGVVVSLAGVWGVW
jgi:hypothetical protein